jgi:uncharacterized protein
MTKVFADTGFWIALFYSKDQWHDTARRYYTLIEAQQIPVFTSEMVLTEYLNFFTRFNANVRSRVVGTVREIGQHPTTTIIPQSSAQFDQAVQLYLDRADQQWSLTDCSSFLLMTELDMTDALAHDKHFEQAGFRALLRQG